MNSKDGRGHETSPTRGGLGSGGGYDGGTRGKCRQAVKNDPKGMKGPKSGGGKKIGSSGTKMW